jgi:hypothetical protein
MHFPFANPMPAAFHGALPLIINRRQHCPLYGTI